MLWNGCSAASSIISLTHKPVAQQARAVIINQIFHEADRVLVDVGRMDYRSGRHSAIASRGIPSQLCAGRAGGRDSGINAGLSRTLDSEQGTQVTLSETTAALCFLMVLLI